MFRKKVIAMILTLILAGVIPAPVFAADIDTDVTESIDLSDPAGSASDNYTVNTSDENGAVIITINANGTYEFTGSGEKTSIVVAKGIEAELILNDAEIDNSNYTNADPGDDDAVIEAGISCKKNSVVSICLAGDSVIKCNSSDPYMENAVKHGKNDNKTLTFSGTGSLTISGTSDDAVKYKGGTVRITDGTLTIKNCYGDGIQAETIDISGGAVDISTVFAQASTGYYTSGTSSVSGYNTIWESGQNTKYERVNVDTGSHKALKGGTKAKTEVYKDGTASSETEASGGIVISGGTICVDTTAAGLKANNISGSGYSATSSGVYIIGSPDDGIHSNNTLTISGGSIEVAASDDGITAASDLQITGNTVINITECYEGIEGGAVVIGESGASSGPVISIDSNDDGINAASKTVTYTYDSSADEDCNYLKQSVSSDSNTCVIYSGSVEIDIDSCSSKSTSLAGKTVTYTASGDGIDCNGSLDIEGGTVQVFGQSSGDNSPIDTDSGFTLSSAATVLAAGCDSMGETAPSSGDGVYLTCTSASGTVTAQKAGSSGSGMQGTMSSGGMSGPGGAPQGGQNGGAPGGTPGGTPGMTGSATIAAGTILNISDGTNTLFCGELPFAASYVLFASPSLREGSTYTVSEGSGSSSGDSGSSAGSTGTDTSGTSDTSEASGTSDTSDASGTSDTSDASDTSDTSGQTQTISKKANTLKVSGRTVSVKYKKLKSNKKVTVSAAKAYKISGAKGSLTYTKISGNKKITVNTKTGKITVKKGLKKGKTYTVKVKVKAAGNSTYSASAKTVKVKIKVN